MIINIFLNAQLLISRTWPCSDASTIAELQLNQLEAFDEEASEEASKETSKETSKEASEALRKSKGLSRSDNRTNS